VLAQAAHVHAIPGTRSVAHFDQNHAAAALEIAPAILDRAGALINQQTVAGHRYPEAIRQTIDTEDY
jgi:aryl-alcohol dehydrogenase-like predicted oxidoreductase